MLPLTDLQDRRRPPVITLLVLAVNFAVFGYELVLAAQSPGAVQAFVRAGAVVPAAWQGDWTEPDLWLRVLTAMTLHGSLAHVAGNGWFLWVFGRTVEDRIGSVRFLLLYLVTGVAATLLQVAVEPTSTVPLIGASGAISGVLGAYFLLLPTAWVLTLVPWIVPLLPVPAVVFLALWFALQMNNGLGSIMAAGGGGAGGIAWWAHVGGFLAGVALAAGRRRRGRSRRRKR